MKEEYHITSDQSVADVINIIAELSTNGRYKVTIQETARTRTLPQNRSLHLYLTMMAKAFNASGQDQKMVINKFKKGFSIPVTMEFLKAVFQETMSGMYAKESTTKLTTTEMTKVYDTFNCGMGERYGISRPWPHKSKDDKK